MQTFAPLINNYCIIDDVLSQAMLHIDKMLLQFIQVMNFCPIDPLMHFAQYLVVHWIKIWTVGSTGLVQLTRLSSIQEV